MTDPMRTRALTRAELEALRRSPEVSMEAETTVFRSPSQGSPTETLEPSLPVALCRRSEAARTLHDAAPPGGGHQAATRIHVDALPVVARGRAHAPRDAAPRDGQRGRGRRVLRAAVRVLGALAAAVGAALWMSGAPQETAMAPVEPRAQGALGAAAGVGQREAAGEVQGPATTPGRPSVRVEPEPRSTEPAAESSGGTPREEDAARAAAVEALASGRLAEARDRYRALAQVSGEAVYESLARALERQRDCATQAGGSECF